MHCRTLVGRVAVLMLSGLVDKGKPLYDDPPDDD